MAWDFSTEPEFQEKLDWVKQFCEEKVEPLDHVFPYAVRSPDPAVKAYVRELQQEVKDQGLWAIFLDAVLPHVSTTEPRESMRGEFHDRYLPLVQKLKRPGDAALALNKALFRDYKVVYNTRRLRPDQSSRESIKQGMATCTGLSIMLVEACRSVAVPARMAGIASWPGRGGNHTWVEVWDSGWHFE